MEHRHPEPTPSSFLDKTLENLGDLQCQIFDEIKHRYPYYKKDWKDAARYAKILIAPTIYVFLNSLIPALAFGQQIHDNTGGTFGISHVLTVTAIGGITQALFGVSLPLTLTKPSQTLTFLLHVLTVTAIGGITQALFGVSLPLTLTQTKL